MYYLSHETIGYRHSDHSACSSQSVQKLIASPICGLVWQVKPPPGEEPADADHGNSGPLSSAEASCPVVLMRPQDFLPFMVPFKGGPGRFCGGACSNVFQWSANADSTCGSTRRFFCLLLLLCHTARFVLKVDHRAAHWFSALDKFAELVLRPLLL